MICVTSYLKDDHKTTILPIFATYRKIGLHLKGLRSYGIVTLPQKICHAASLSLWHLSHLDFVKDLENTILYTAKSASDWKLLYQSI